MPAVEFTIAARVPLTLDTLPKADAQALRFEGGDLERSGRATAEARPDKGRTQKLCGLKVATETWAAP